MFIRKSAIRLPHRPNVPVIMIGPGTGFAPFRGFIQDRDCVRKEGKEIGAMVLYFGCRKSKEDYIYRDEIEGWLANKTLTEVHLAFSRDQHEKTYVQHKLWDNRVNTWKLMDEMQAHIYVCGDARSMSREVMDVFHKIVCQVGGKTEAESNEYMKKMETTKRYQADVWS
jgi:NADPH-ferrihemoprotein reductase